MKRITIVIPIFRLSSNRLANFLFLLKKIQSVVSVCDVKVVDQVSEKTYIQTIVRMYPDITYIPVSISDGVFNKSILINRVCTDIKSEFIWIIDADFYTNFELVVSEINNFSDFTRPFGEVILLNETESSQLIDSDYVQINRDEYESSLANGKYSFIIRTSVFIESGMMNENFKGWGFQDLDFVENRLVSCKISNIDTPAFHLWHTPASRKYVNENKLIYGNFIEPKHITTDPVPIKKPVIQQSCSVDDTNAVRNITNIKQDTHKHEHINHIHVTYENSTFFDKHKPHLSTIIKAHVTKKQTRTLTGTLDVKRLKKNFIYYYLKFIVDNYQKLTGTICFSNDYFCNNETIFNLNNQLLIDNSFKSDNKITQNFEWVTKTTRENSKSTKPTHKIEFISKSISGEGLGVYSKLGIFKINSDLIKKNPISYYKKILDNTELWSSREYEWFLINLQKIFLTNIK